MLTQSGAPETSKSISPDTRLRVALTIARSHIVALGGEPIALSCTIHTAVVAKIDEALASAPPAPHPHGSATAPPVPPSTNLGSLKGAVVLAIGVVLGAGSAIGSAHLFPHSRMTPVLFSENDLRFGTAENGRPALCDRDLRAYTVGRGSSGLGYLSEERTHEPTPDAPYRRVIVALSCVTTEPERRANDISAGVE